jgi:hypothetical protein
MIGAFLRTMASVVSFLLHSVTIANAISTIRIVRSTGLPSRYDSDRPAAVCGELAQDVTGLDMTMSSQQNGTKFAFEIQPLRRSSQKSPLIPTRQRKVA